MLRKVYSKKTDRNSQRRGSYDLISTNLDRKVIDEILDEFKSEVCDFAGNIDKVIDVYSEVDICRNVLIAIYVICNRINGRKGYSRINKKFYNPEG